MNTSTASLKLGTLGGTVAAAVPSIQRDTLLEAVVLAGVGACVSFVVSLFLKWLFKALKTWFLNRSNPN
ncbi:hypothetical protein LDL79_02715 [Leeuwenhoekiella palythoae]|uniref:hypothetical protein n=1 Tax=Leeuwenhoekiella palythoae TaxID=573501 RepID=UPI001CE20EC3|nr:hypothetical protein [Leeuwenhoekiella palythoae]UBZ11040.1 hypothetical protein LDL79_02715 [Leeuwenhoekiella palythoae]